MQHTTLSASRRDHSDRSAPFSLTCSPQPTG
jgi:hypothetical protein